MGSFCEAAAAGISGSFGPRSALGRTILKSFFIHSRKEFLWKKEEHLTTSGTANVPR